MIRTDRCQKDVRIALLADLHNHSLGEANIRLIQAIEREKPDMIVIAGDMITAHEGGQFQNALSVFESLSDKYPVYYGCGNHETKLREYPERYGQWFGQYEDAVEQTGISMLHNQVVEVPELGMNIYGLELPACFFVKFHKSPCKQKDIEQLIGKPDPEKFSLLIGHNPELFEEYAEWGADLVVSGHQHGGIARIPWIGGVISTGYKLFPEYDGGLFSRGKSNMVISRGLGTHTIPVRFLNPCELAIIDIKQMAKCDV